MMNTNNKTTDNKMSNSIVIKTNMGENKRMVELGSASAAASFAELEKAIRLTYETSPNDKLTLTYTDAEGDDVTFDTDAELALAVRTCSSPLRVTVKCQGTAPQTQATAADAMDEDDADIVLLDAEDEEMGRSDNDPVSGTTTADQGDSDNGPVSAAAEAEASKSPEASPLFKRAARRLGRVHSVDITPTQLAAALTLLQLRPRVLAKRGLAPARFLRAGAAGGEATSSDAEEDVDKDSKDKKSTEEASAQPEPSGVRAAARPCPEGRGHCGHRGGHRHGPGGRVPPMGPVAVAFWKNGIELAPPQVRALLRALGVGPRRLVKVGLLDMNTLRSLRAFRLGWQAAAHAHGARAGRHCGGRGGGGGGGWGGEVPPLAAWGAPYMHGPPPHLTGFMPPHIVAQQQQQQQQPRARPYGRMHAPSGPSGCQMWVHMYPGAPTPPGPNMSGLGHGPNRSCGGGVPMYGGCGGCNHFGRRVGGRRQCGRGGYVSPHQDFTAGMGWGRK